MVSFKGIQANHACHADGSQQRQKQCRRKQQPQAAPGGGDAWPGILPFADKQKRSCGEHHHDGRQDNGRQALVKRLIIEVENFAVIIRIKRMQDGIRLMQACPQRLAELHIFNAKPDEAGDAEDIGCYSDHAADRGLLFSYKEFHPCRYGRLSPRCWSKLLIQGDKYAALPSIRSSGTAVNANVTANMEWKRPAALRGFLC